MTSFGLKHNFVARLTYIGMDGSGLLGSENRACYFKKRHPNFGK